MIAKYYVHIPCLFNCFHNYKCCKSVWYEEKIYKIIILFGIENEKIKINGFNFLI